MLLEGCSQVVLTAAVLWVLVLPVSTVALPVTHPGLRDAVTRHVTGEGVPRTRPLSCQPHNNTSSYTHKEQFVIKKRQKLHLLKVCGSCHL